MSGTGDVPRRLIGQGRKTIPLDRFMRQKIREEVFTREEIRDAKARSASQAVSRMLSTPEGFRDWFSQGKDDALSRKQKALNAEAKIKIGR